MSEIKLNLLPGPISISKEVRSAFEGVPVSHRSQAFMEKFAETKRLLLSFCNSRFVELFMSSGTMANDAVAAQLGLLDKKGLILSCGEFGDRLINHAERALLNFSEVRKEWGSHFTIEEIESALSENDEIDWLWMTHCETSTGILVNLDKLTELCLNYDVKLCLDCTSTVGTVDMDLSGVFLASSVSGKGLQSIAGVSMVFYKHPISIQTDRIPRYLDIGYYASKNGVPFTISSNLVYALHASLSSWNPSRFENIRSTAGFIRERLKSQGHKIVGDEAHLSPAVTTFELNETMDSGKVGDQLMEDGYLVSYRSSYLLEKNWIQICLMNNCTNEELEDFLSALAGYN